MLRLFFLAVTAVLLVAVGYLFLPRNASRPDAHLDAPSTTTAPDPTTFTVHQAAPAPPPVAAAPVVTPPPAPVATGQAAPGDLDAVMQRLRAAAAQHPDTAPPENSASPFVVTPAMPAPPMPLNTSPLATSPLMPSPLMTSPPGTVPTVAPPVVTPGTPAPSPAVIIPSAPSLPSGSRWTSVTPQGARWRMTPASGGFVIGIDLGGNRVASVHVTPAFSNLDPSSMNQRVDFLKQTILQNFPPESASYTFARDGSVSLDR